MNVFDIEDLGGSLRATAARPRDCTLCRECVREGRWPNKVTARRVHFGNTRRGADRGLTPRRVCARRVQLRLGRMKDHFIFSIESTGALPPQDLFKEALRWAAPRTDADHLAHYESLPEDSQDRRDYAAKHFNAIRRADVARDQQAA